MKWYIYEYRCGFLKVTVKVVVFLLDGWLIIMLNFYLKR